MQSRERKELIVRAMDNPQLQAALKEKCKRDPLYWFDTFCWTFDPRKEPAIIPFNLYDYQRDFIKALYQAVDQQYDIGIEKSRDMGVSWVVALFFQWCWLYKPGWNFHIGNRVEDLNDTLGDISTIFEKLRFNMMEMPIYMRPEGFSLKTHSNFMRMKNPENGNIITGEAASPNFGRGGRYRAVFLDEFAQWPWADPAWTSVSQSTRCRIVNGTPFGGANKYAKLMNDPENEVLPIGA